MQEYFLIGCKPINSKKGTEAVLYLYGESGTKVCNIRRPHIFCTRRIPYEDATRLQNNLVKRFSNQPDVQIRKIQSGKYYVVQVIGPRELKKELPELFIKTSNVSDLLDWAFPAFSKVSIENNEKNKEIRITEPASLEEILKWPILAIDLELDKKNTQNYIRINTAAVVGENYKTVFNIFDFDMRMGCSQKKLIAQLEKIIYDIDPPIICSHNIAFDLLQPKEKVGAFCIGVDGGSPVIKGGIGLKRKKSKNNGEEERKGFPKIEVAGRQLFCSMSFARNNLWSSNNKLSTVANFLGIQYEKGLDYEELEELVQKAERGDAYARECIKTYCLEDCEIHLKLAKRLLPIALREALAFETDLMSVCFTSKATLARKLRDKRYFESLGTYRRDRTTELQEFDIYAEKIRMMKSALNLETKRGYFTEPLIVVFPRFLEFGFFDLLSRERAAAILRQGIAKSQSPIDKIIFRRDLEALCEEPLFDLYAYKNSTDKMKDVFLGRYKIDPNIIERKLFASLEDFKNLLKVANVEVINYSNRFLFLKPKENLKQSLQILERSPLVDVYATTKTVISGSSGRILASIDGIAITSQLDIYGRKGLRTDFEREIYSYLLDFITGKLARSKLFTILKQRFVDLAQGKVPKIDLVYHIEAEFEPQYYSWPAQETERVKALKDLGARQGDKFVFGYGIGEDGKPKRCKIEEFLKNDIELNIARYQEKFFGEEAKKGGRKFPDGSISDLIYSICPACSTSERVELGRFFEGKAANLARWGIYSNHTQAKLF
ncbi:MAG: hypothetical protein QW063_01820 [Candidatus Nanoarchaeia archaeon]